MAKAQTKKEETVTKIEKPADTSISRGMTAETNPFTLMRHLAEDMEKMMADFGFVNKWRSPFFRDELMFPTFTGLDLAPLMSENAGLLKRWSPQIEVLHNDQELIVRVDLPGLTKDDVKVEITDNLLTIEGERKQESEEQAEGFYRSERAYGNFYRAIPLPEGAKTDKAKAAFNNGVLEIKLETPKIAKTAKRLEVTGTK
jgi:HSP20 family protein